MVVNGALPSIVIKIPVGQIQKIIHLPSGLSHIKSVELEKDISENQKIIRRKKPQKTFGIEVFYDKHIRTFGHGVF